MPLPTSLPKIELERGVPARLERPEVRHDVWFDPGMLRGDGASDERCCRIRFRFFTVWKTRFGWSLESGSKKYTQLLGLVSINPKTLFSETVKGC